MNTSTSRIVVVGGTAGSVTVVLPGTPHKAIRAMHRVAVSAATQALRQVDVDDANPNDYFKGL
jgi:hypothetical protein